MKKIQIITINTPKHLATKLKLIARIVFGKSIDIISMESISKEMEMEQEEIKQFLKVNRPFFANIENSQALQEKP